MAELQQPDYGLAQKLGFYSAGGNDPGYTNADQFNKGLATTNAFTDIIKNVLSAKKASLEQQPVGNLFGVPSERQSTSNVQSTLNQAQQADIPVADLVSGNLDTMQKGINTASQQALGDQTKRSDFTNQFKINPGTPLWLAESGQKLAMTPTEMGFKQAETAKNWAEAHKDMNPVDKTQYLAFDTLPEDSKKRARLGGYKEGDKLSLEQYNALKSNPDLNLGLREDQQQDAMEEKARTRLSSMRGDASLARTENQRDAAIQAYSTITQAEKEGRILTKPEYYDILGQLWKARSGAAPTIEAIRDLDNTTFKGDMSKAFTYITGQPAGATTQAVMDNVKNFAKSTGMQMDKLHDGYMQTHLDMPSRLAPERADKLRKLSRGLSFADATGAANEQNLQVGNQSPRPGGVLHQDKNGSRAWVYPDGTFDEVK